MVKRSNGRIEFSFYRPQARHVYLAGDFNNWRHGELMMSRQEDGYWKAFLELPVGSYRFRYCADGLWYTDFAAFGVEPGKFGFDSVVLVEDKPAAQIQQPVKKVTRPTRRRTAAAAAVAA